MSGFDFVLNGERLRVEKVAPTTPLLDYLRSIGKTGSKLGCAEGDCGACTVALVERDAEGQTTYRAFNSCIAPIASFAGREVVTVEGLGKADGALHPVQTAMVDRYGSQCGFCTPGFVVSLFEGYYRRDCSDSAAINGQLCGNLCRCTGYRPIRDAAAAAFAGRTGAPEAGDPFAERLARPLEALPSVAYAPEGGAFFRPASLEEFWRVRRANPEAVLIAGATELGVDVNKKFRALPNLISLEGIPELTGIASSESEWRVGAAATITNVEQALKGEYPALVQMFSVFAARQIRNRATLGGNLVTASPIGDSAPVLLALDASVVLAHESAERTLPLSEFFLGYRRTALKPGEILRAVVIPRRKNLRTAFYKVSHRRELDISIVAAAFAVETDSNGMVRHARIAYGGMAATTVRVAAAERVLAGRTLAEAEADVARIIGEAFQPLDDVRASAAYRRGAAVGLWGKFVAGEAPEIPGLKPAWTLGENFAANDSSRLLRHESAVGHVTGAARYVDDIARRRPMLELWPVCSPHARARILRRDATRARACPGVAAVLMAEDIPGANNVGVARHDETLLAGTEVLYHGHLVAVVVGESAAVCRAAAALVEVEYEPLACVVGIPAAMAADSYHTEPHVIARGDARQALEASPRRLRGEFSFGGQEHFYLETQAAWAEIGDEGDVFICSSTQHPSEIQTIVAEVLRRSKHEVIVQSPRMGGGFGGKETQGNTSAALVALAALKTGRAVRVHWDRDLDLALTGKRHPFYSRFDVGYDEQGRFLAAHIALVSDGGWSLDLSQPVLDRALFHLDNAYYIPAVRFSGRVAKTNVTSHTAFRGFGGPQGMLVIEEIVDRIARTLGVSPEQIRERNLYHGSGDSNITHFLEEIKDNPLRAMWTRALQSSDFAARRAAIDDGNSRSKWIRRGLAITPVKFGISFTLSHYNQAGALVLIYDDGTVQVNHGGTEMGQGLHTKIKGIAMRELGVTAERVRMMHTTTDKVPNTSATAASSGADLNGAAVRTACVTLRERLAPVAAQLLSGRIGRAVDPAEVRFEKGQVFLAGQPERGFTFAEISKQATLDRVSLSTTGYYRTPGVVWDWNTSKGRPFFYFACGVAVSEVEVDGSTGMSRVLRVDIVHDVGDSLNPGVDRGQIEGGFVQGMGWLTSEELKWDGKGRLLTHSASTYQIPAISDAPVEFNVELYPHGAREDTIHGSKAVGEPPLMLAMSVREAIRDAVSTFGAPGGLTELASPATGEAVFAAIQRRMAESRSGVPPLQPREKSGETPLPLAL
ncbi:MAG TPA: xanthine dehydrogenase molybdopterin binding subunit [Opitutaceae bacterium]|jgi:xanthine dehydrogenase molybdopterin binding subunit/xanthine dehydrogenase small subunit